MGRLLQLLAKNGGFMTFLLVELLSFYIIISFNTERNAIFSHTAGIIGGKILDKRKQWVDYGRLRKKADSLAIDNARLHEKLADARHIQVPYRDTIFIQDADTLLMTDSLRRLSVRPQYEFIAAKTVGNSISGANNWLIVNRGSDDRIRPDMGVVSSNGVVGIVRHVSSHFSMVMSVLHHQTKISVVLKRNNALGSLLWEGGDPSIMTLKFIPRHFKIKENDVVVTSGYSKMFPKGITVGHVTGEPKQDAENPYFWKINVRLSQDMASVDNVYLVNNIFYSELDSLNLKVKDE